MIIKLVEDSLLQPGVLILFAVGTRNDLRTNFVVGYSDTVS